MLKKIPIQQVRLGMHLHALEGAWIDHPFWKTRFLLTDPQDLKRLQSSGVRECWIDAALGADSVSAAPAAPGPPLQPPDAEPNASQPEPIEPAAAIDGPTSMADELQQAAAICNRGRAAVTAMFNEVRLGQALDPEKCLPLVQEISASVMRNPGALISLARLKTQDDYSYMHSVAVCALMVALARQLGMDQEACRQAGLAGLLHDMGKALMPPELLKKPGKLTEAEFTLMRTHPQRGHDLLHEGGGAGAEVLDVCLHHHERMDGTGYPHALPGERISTLARMGAICDVYDAITSNRPYKSGWDPAESIARMASWKGHFDPFIFQAFVRSLGIYPTGSLVRLQSQHLAIVVEQNPHSLLAPKVKIFYSLRSKEPVPPRPVDLGREDCKDRIVGREPAQAWSALNLDALWAGDTLPQRH